MAPIPLCLPRIENLKAPTDATARNHLRPKQDAIYVLHLIYLLYSYKIRLERAPVY